MAYFHTLGLRERTLTLPVMMAFVLSLIWRRIGSVTEAVRCKQREGLLWTAPLPVVATSRQATPAFVAGGAVSARVPQGAAVAPRACCHSAAAAVPALAHASAHRGAIVAFDGSTLDTLLRKVGLLRGTTGPALAGRIVALLDVVSRLPHQIWYEAESTAHDQTFWQRVQAALQPSWWVLFDLGFVNYALFDALSAAGIGFVTRLKQNAAVTVLAEQRQTSAVREARTRLGRGASVCTHELRLIEVRVGERWHCYVINVLNAPQLLGGYVAGLYAERWPIENGLHWVLDVDFGEDAHRAHTEHSTENFAVLRHIALNLLKQERTAKIGIKGNRLKACWDEAYQRKVLLSI